MIVVKVVFRIWKGFYGAEIGFCSLDGPHLCNSCSVFTGLGPLSRLLPSTKLDMSHYLHITPNN